MQRSAGDVPFVECLSSQGILPGIKVDEVSRPARQVIFHHFPCSTPRPSAAAPGPRPFACGGNQPCRLVQM